MLVLISAAPSLFPRAPFTARRVFIGSGPATGRSKVLAGLPEHHQALLVPILSGRMRRCEAVIFGRSKVHPGLPENHQSLI